jgi:hypothetical protein
MSTNKFKQQVRPEVEHMYIKGMPMKNAPILRNMLPEGAEFTTSGLPSAAGLPDGLLAYNTDLDRLVVTTSGAWV